MSKELVSALLATAAGLLVAVPAGAAEAESRSPATTALVVAPSDPGLLVLRTTFGVLLSHDAGQTWSWICGSAMGSSAGDDDPPVAVTASGALLGGVSTGLSVSPDTGCSWHLAPELAGWTAIDFDAPSQEGHRAVSLARSALETRLFVSDDDGARWAPMGAPLDAASGARGELAWRPRSVEVAASDARRVYVAAGRDPGDGSRREDLALFVSDDAGATWAERPVPAPPPEVRSSGHGAEVVVDPRDADRVFVRAAAASSLYLSEDAGRTFRPLLAFRGEMQGFALSPTGQTLYAGGPTDGLWVADASTLMFQRVSDVPVKCLTVSGETLYACSDDQTFALGASNNGGATFEPLLRLAAVRGTLSCPATSQTAACAELFPSLCQSLGDCPGDTAPSVAAPSRSCACALPGGGRDGGTGGVSDALVRASSVRWGALASLASLALWRRSRKARRSARSGGREEARP